MEDNKTEWGKGSINNDINWGTSHRESHSGSTNITGEEEEPTTDTK